MKTCRKRESSGSGSLKWIEAAETVWVAVKVLERIAREFFSQSKVNFYQ